MANQMKPDSQKDAAPASTGKLFLPLCGVYPKLITAEALVQTRQIIGSTETDRPKKHTLPRPDDVLRNQAVMQEMMEVVDMKKKLKDILGYEPKIELKPGQKLKEAVEQKLEFELKQKQELVNRLYPKLTPPGSPK